MFGPIDPIRPVRLIRRQPRPTEQNAPETKPAPAVNVTVNIAADQPEPAWGFAQPSISPDAHLAAQNARVRGLRAGPQVLETARCVYLETEWSGPHDRRVRTGRITKTEA
ncbi:MAG TPA: hypothetical protein VMU37_00440 [Caulobacteraceae bacterium]|nr:hypothetical protein [Caulobacteraceae bacterium]